MTNHTPAPWFIDDNGDISGCSQRDWVATSSDGITFKSDADCYLILAAPDMYEALRRAKSILRMTEASPSALREISSALKKARGEA